MMLDSRAPQPTDAASRRHARLTDALLVKLFIEALFVVALAVYFSYTNFNPYFRGAVDVADAQRVAGWVVNEAAPGERVEVQLYLNGHFVKRRAADSPRPDVLQSGRSLDAAHGFDFTLPLLPPGLEYEARVYALQSASGNTRRTLQQIGETKLFKVAANDENHQTPEAWWEGERH